MLHKFSLIIVYNLMVVINCLQMLTPKMFNDFRIKRSLIYPEGERYVQYVFGIGLPIELKQKSITIGVDARYTYSLPDNSSFFTQHSKIVSLRNRQNSFINRWDIYNIMSSAIDRLGLGGKECILQTICQIAGTPFELNHSIFEEIFHLIFTPSSTSEQLLNNADNEYLAAEQLGKNGGECEKIFSKCEINFANIFSKVV